MNFKSFYEKKGLIFKGAPECPVCGNPLNHVLNDAKGHVTEKCLECSKISLVNLETLEAKRLHN